MNIKTKTNEELLKLVESIETSQAMQKIYPIELLRDIVFELYGGGIGGSEILERYVYFKYINTDVTFEEYLLYLNDTDFMCNLMCRW